MSDRFRREPPREPVIGEEYPPVIGGYEPDEPVIGLEEDDREAWGDGGSYPDEYEEEAYEPEWEYGLPEPEPSEARQPLLYVFLALVLGFAAVLAYLVLDSLRGNGPGEPSAALRIDRPLNEDRVTVGTDAEVAVRAAADEPITRFELYVNGKLVDSQDAGTPQNGVYSATLRYRLESPGVYELLVRAVLQSGAVRESDRIRVVGVETVGERPVTIEGEVIAATTVRAGPGDSYPSLRTLEAGSRIRVTARTTDNAWLLLEGGGWVRRSAIRLLDSIEFLPRRDPTPTPVPTQTPTPEASPSPSPTPGRDRPDLTPVNASLGNGGTTLTITVANLSPNVFEGPLEVEVAGIPGGTRSRVFQVRIAENGNTTIVFELEAPITGSATVRVTVDPSNAIPELSEDNNSASFSLAPPTPAPSLSIVDVQVDGNQVRVRVRNDGGPLPATSVTVRVTANTSDESQQVSRSIALASGQETEFTVARPSASGQATVEVLIGSTVVASRTITLS